MKMVRVRVKVGRGRLMEQGRWKDKFLPSDVPDTS